MQRRAEQRRERLAEEDRLRPEEPREERVGDGQGPVPAGAGGRGAARVEGGGLAVAVEAVGDGDALIVFFFFFFFFFFFENEVLFKKERGVFLEKKNRGKRKKERKKNLFNDEDSPRTARTRYAM